MTLGATRASMHLLARSLAGTQVVDLARITAEWLGADLGDLSTPSGFWWEYAAILKVLLSILVEGLPEDSIFWRLPLETMERLLTGIVKCCFIYALAVGDLDAWVTVLWIFASLLMAAIG